MASSRNNAYPQSATLWLTLSVCLAALSGCEVFDKPLLVTGARKKLPALHAPPDAIRLEIVFVERPVGDSLLGPELWQQVDQLASLEHGSRGLIKQNGFRVGVVGSHPPAALQTMLGLKSDFVYEPDAEKSKQLVGRQVFLRSGWTTEVQVSPLYAECDLEVRQGEQKVARQFRNARCLYQITAERVQDGWVRLDFVPQVRHGTEQFRYAPGSTDWVGSTAQKLETFYPQRFSLNLSVGEMAVLSADEQEIAESTLGRLFFLGPGFGAPGSGSENRANGGDVVQRLLVVRLADMQNNDDPYAHRK